MQGLNACKMTCSSRGNLWPVPTGRVQVSQELVKFLPQELRLVAVTAPSDQVRGRINGNENNTMTQLNKDKDNVNAASEQVGKGESGSAS